jgi:hypothetical protein
MLYKGVLEEGRSYVYEGMSGELYHHYHQPHPATEPEPASTLPAAGQGIPHYIVPPAPRSSYWWATDWIMIVGGLMVVSSLGYLIVLWGNAYMKQR